jgi:hypothetical protein
MHKLLFVLAALFFSNPSLAGNASGKITSIFVADGTPSALFMLNTAISETPRCNEAKRFSINLAKPGGMATYMAILEAKKQGYEVSVEGLNTCVNEWRSEDIKNILLN